jgi:hypothetical protein
MKKIILISTWITGLALLLFVASCGNAPKTDVKNASDSSALAKDSVKSVKPETENDTLSSTGSQKKDQVSINKGDLPKVEIYNFHVTNRCASCIAIEEATTKTLNNYFANEMKQGRIKRQILNVDDNANKTVSEKYQAFGSSVFVTRIFKGKETTTDLTGDGFKYAKNKEEKFIEILKNTISGYLK